MKPRIGVFGAHRGMSMIRMLLAYPEAELVAVCDKYVPALEQVKQEAEAAGMNPALYESFEDFILHDMDAVVLANYATEHATFAVRCLDKGLHVLSECLPCETMAQAVALVEAVERSGKVYAYAENCCYMPWAFEMWQLYKEGGLGDVTYAECEYLHDCTSIWPQITYGDPNHWRNLMHPTFYCTHSLGPIITATGRRPVQVTGYECPRLDYSLETMGIRAVDEITFQLDVVSSENWMDAPYVAEYFTIYPTGRSADTVVYPVRQTLESQEVLVDDENMTFIIEYVEEQDLNYAVRCYIENKTAGTLMTNWENVTVNGVPVDPFWTALVAPGKSAYADVLFNTADLENAGIDVVEQIDFDLFAYDDADWTELVHITATYLPQEMVALG